MLYELQEALKAISGFDAVTLQPAAGAHGEFAGVLMIRAYHQARGDAERDLMLIPDSAHGTNPASTAMCGYRDGRDQVGRARQRRSGRPARALRRARRRA